MNSEVDWKGTRKSFFNKRVLASIACDVYVQPWYDFYIFPNNSVFTIQTRYLEVVDAQVYKNKKQTRQTNALKSLSPFAVIIINRRDKN